MTKTFQVEKKGGRREWVVIRQAEHDPKYAIGSKIPGCGVVIAVRGSEAEEMERIERFARVRREVKYLDMLQQAENMVRPVQYGLCAGVR